MKRPADAIVTGFTRNAELSRHSFAPLLQLKQEGLIRNVHYVTWSGAGIDSFVAPVAALPGVSVKRVPMPAAYGNLRQKTVSYQVGNLEAALNLIPDDDALVLKLRPDFVIDTNFLRVKLVNFDQLSLINDEAHAFGVKLPRVPFARKVMDPLGRREPALLL